MSRSIYVVSISDEGPVKIGIASNMSTRLSGIQTGSPVKLTVSHLHIVHGDAFALEKAVHASLASRRLHGEWFDVSVHIAVEAISGQLLLREQRPNRVSPAKLKPIKEKPKNFYTTERESLGFTVE